ncbi:MAG: hypothetical protein NT090_15250 [Acidobacteria bacterium]|nr:hypothetical protein [Acidobacteriota bacterium]
MSWVIRYARSVEKDIRSLPPELHRRLFQILADLTVTPIHSKAEKLSGYPALYKIRLDRDNRIVYKVPKEEKTINLEYVGDRKNAYRFLRHR